MVELVDTTDLRSVAGVPACGFESLQADITVCDGMYTCGLEKSVPERDWECESPRTDNNPMWGNRRPARLRIWC